MAESVDALVSNTNDSNIVPVRPRLWVHIRRGLKQSSFFAQFSYILWITIISCPLWYMHTISAAEISIPTIPDSPGKKSIQSLSALSQKDKNGLGSNEKQKPSFVKKA